MIKNTQQQQGFTLVEAMIVITIIAVLASIAYPSYQGYIEKGNRVDMMTELQNIASNIESQKLAKGTYTQVDVSSYTGGFPRQGTAKYQIAITPLTGNNLTNSEWKITARPVVTEMMADDGALSLDHHGVKCKTKSPSDKKCGKASQWNE